MLYVSQRSTIALPQAPSHYGVEVDFSLYLEHASFLSQTDPNRAIILWLLLRHARKIMPTHVLLVKARHVDNPLLMGWVGIRLPGRQCRHMPMGENG